MLEVTPDSAPVAHALHEVNQAHSRDWVLERPLTGGFQGGAWLIREGDATAVFKWTDAIWWAPRVLGAAELIPILRERGYPTPAWQVVGTTSSGGPYTVQDRVPGGHVEGLDLNTARLILELTDLQQTIHPKTDVCWSRYTRDTVFGDEQGTRMRVAASCDAAGEAMRVMRELSRPFVDVGLVENELVHGDLNVSNLMIHNAQIAGVVDIEAIGRGCAVFDLLTPALNGAIWKGDREAVDALTECALSRYGAGAVAVTASAQVVDILAFGLRNWAEGDLPVMASRCSARLRELQEQL